MALSLFKFVVQIFKDILELIKGVFAAVIIPPLLLIILSVFFLPLSIQAYFLLTYFTSSSLNWLVFIYNYSLYGLGIIYTASFILVGFYLATNKRFLIENGIIKEGISIYCSLYMLLLIGMHIDLIIWSALFGL